MAEKEKSIVGKTIKSLRPMSKRELADQGWAGAERRLGPLCVTIELDDGTCLYASQDSEGNGPGVVFGHDQDGAFTLMAERS